MSEEKARELIYNVLFNNTQYSKDLKLEAYHKVWPNAYNDNRNEQSN